MFYAEPTAPSEEVINVVGYESVADIGLIFFSDNFQYLFSLATKLKINLKIDYLIMEDFLKPF